MAITNFEKLLSAERVNAFVREIDYTPTRIDQLFPAVKTPDMTAKTIYGANGLPVVASIHAFDTVTEIASRDDIQLSEVQKTLIKRQIPLREELILMLNHPRTQAELGQTAKQVFDDIGNMVLSVKTKARVMAAEALSTGTVTTQNENNLTGVTVDYQLPVNHFDTLSGTSAWTDDAATPMNDLQEWMAQIVADGGERPAYAITSQAVISALVQHVSIRNAIYGAGSERVLNPGELNAYFASMGLPQFIAFDEKYRQQKRDGSYEVKSYIDPNKVILVPNGSVGQQEYGPTAEELELTADPSNQIISQQHVVAQVYRTPDPVARWTKAVGTCMPSFARANEVFIATVKE